MNALKSKFSQNPDSKWAKLAEPYRKEALESLKAYVAIPSYNDPSTVTKEHPFGAGVAKALDFVAQLGAKHGFAVDRCDGYCTELSYGEGPLIDVYAHSDTVPVTRENWKTDPFALTIVGDSMYGRGTNDDKGPGLACFYGVIALKDAGLIDGYKVRFVFGGNEELDFRCLNHYFHEMHKGYPAYGISPDAEYPLIYGEKACCNYSASYKLDLGKAPFHWGTALNLVCDTAVYDFANCGLEFEKAKRVVDNYLSDHTEVKGTWEGTVLSLKGFGYHGSMPWFGVNAGLYMLNIIGKVKGIQILHDLYEDYKSGDGQPFGGNYKSKAFDRSSYCVGYFDYVEGKLTLRVNMRLPENVEFDEAIHNVKEKTKPDALTIDSETPVLYIDPDSPFIKTLMKVYREETNDKASQPLAIGGGTYAKDSKNTVAFGGAYNDVDFHMHGDNEFFSLANFNDDIGIFARAIYEIGNLAKKGSH